EWTLNTDACTIEAGDYVKVVDTGNTRLEAVDCDGEAIWYSPSIDISAYTNISISGLIAELGSSGTITSKYIKLYYKLDGGSEILIGELLGNQVSPNPNAFTVNTNIIDGVSLQVVVRMKLTVASTNKIYIDDIAVIGTPIVISNDALTQVLEPTSQVSPQNISSIANDINSAQTLLRFKLTEPNGPDDLNTKIASIKFTNVATENIADLSSQFVGFALHNGTDFIPTSSVSINSDELIMNFAEGDFTLPDDSSQEYELRAYLKSAGIIDGKKVKLELAAGASGITTYESGSRFDAASSIAVTSSEHQISVVATNVNFTTIPTSNIIKNSNFSVSLNATDVNGNIDLDAAQNVDLNLDFGGGVLGGILSNSLTLGQVEFADISYNEAGDIRLNASAIGLNIAISYPISIISSQSTDLTIPVWTPSVSKISSLINSLEDAIEVFRFSVNDKGDDLESTILNSLRLLSGDNNTVNWEETIAGFVIKIGDVSLDAACNFDNSSLNISISDTELLRVISEGTSRELSVYAYLKNKVEDGQVLQMKMANTHEGWSTSGSGLVPNFIGDLFGPELTIEVVGTHLHFKSVPSEDVDFSSNFRADIELTDLNENLDLDATQNVNISVIQGKGSLAGTLDKNLISGAISFADLLYNYSESIRLLVTGEGLHSGESEMINILASKSTYAKVVNWILEDINISSLSVSEADFQEVFRFQVSDTGDDQVSSVLKTIRLISGNMNTLNWQDDIGGFCLKINDEIVDAEYMSSENDLIITFAESEVLSIIPDGNTIELSLFLYLTENSTDETVFQAAIEKIHSMWEVSGSGLINEFTESLVGNGFVVDVVGTELSFINKPPKVLSPNSNFGMELKTTDKFGNRDLNSLNEARVSLAAGTGYLTSNTGLSVNMIGGKYSWTDLTHDKAENFTLMVEVDEMNPVMSDNISSLDANSTVVSSEVPIVSKELNPLVITPDNSEVVLKFSIKDTATFDQAPTIINSMKFYNKLVGLGLDWKNHLAGAVIMRNGEVLAKTRKIETESISFSSLDIEVANGTETDLELGIYFKKSLLPDHAKFQVEIRKDHDWKTSTTASSLMAEFSENIQSALHYIEINSDRLSFVSCPTGIASDDTFALIIAAVDEYQNIDIDKTSLLNLSLTSGEGSLSQEGSIGYLANGILEITDLTYSGNQTFELSVSGDLMAANQSIFVQEESLVLFDDFESQSLSAWENTSDWTSSSYLLINGSYSLKHNLTNAIGKSFIAQPLDNIHIGSESIYWEFILKNSDWDPTSSNKFVFHLLMDFNNPDLADNLYSVGVNMSGSDDKLSLWKTNDEDLELLIKSDFDWNEDETVAVKVEYTAKGEWKFYYNRLGEKNNWLEAGIAFSEVEGDVETWYSGLEFNFETASRAGEFWFDDIKVESYNTAPFLKTYAVFSDSIVLDFSEDVNFIESSKFENFVLKRDAELVLFKEVKATGKKNQLVLVAENKFITGQYKLQISEIEDLQGAVSMPEELAFDFFEEAKIHDLVINEILADETPIVGLPEYEFIEIYNASDYPINVKDYKLKVGGSEKTLSGFEIQAHDYLILCSNAASELYREFGNSLGVSSFTSLTNSGTSISVESSSGVLLDQVTYSSDWYGDNEKKNGGWSLERIDITNFCSTASNWAVSENIKCGTPGSENSIKGIYEDNIAPVLKSHVLLSNQELQVEFSESTNEDAALFLSNYTIEGNLVSSIIKESSNVLRLHFENAFQDGEIQKLRMNNLTDECENSQEISVDFLWHDIHEYDIVINEIFADETPIVGLPEYEFIEIYNASDYPINVKDYKLKVGGSEKTLSGFEIQAH
ncbi:lamin tail domain-containing protein, partial [Ancylomarina sp.]|uniref:lamin tail domain-containing protein n=1 Tax=Ancylomarina sp. TaxID=1970196 RepID=UPI003568168A